MKILIHDFSGLPFQAQLSRELAMRGHEVIYVPAVRGSVACDDGGSGGEVVAGCRVVPVACGEGGRGRSLTRRLKDEAAYGRKVAAVVAAERPGAVISSDAPTASQEWILRACRGCGAAFYSWLQDIHSLAQEKEWRSRFPMVGRLAGAYYRWLEGSQLRAAAGVVVMSDELAPILRREFGVNRHRMTTIPSWAPLESTPVQAKRNAWSESQGLADKSVLLYAGRLEMSQNPALLLELARRYRGQEHTRVVVAAEGTGADWLREQTANDPLPQLIQLPCQPASVMPDVLATGDVLIGVIGEHAGPFSVPAPLLTCLCAGRPILLAAPSTNPLTRIVARERIGMTCAPQDVSAFLEAADHLRSQPGLGPAMGRRARAFAEKSFRVDLIADRFETVLGASAKAHSVSDRVATATGTQVLAA